MGRGTAVGDGEGGGIAAVFERESWPMQCVGRQQTVIVSTFEL